MLRLSLLLLLNLGVYASVFSAIPAHNTTLEEMETFAQDPAFHYVGFLHDTKENPLMTSSLIQLVSDKNIAVFITSAAVIRQFSKKVLATGEYNIYIHPTQDLAIVVHFTTINGSILTQFSSIIDKIKGSLLNLFYVNNSPGYKIASDGWNGNLELNTTYSTAGYGHTIDPQGNIILNKGYAVTKRAFVVKLDTYELCHSGNEDCISSEQQLYYSSLSPNSDSKPSGIAFYGDTGSPLLRQHPDGYWEIVAVTTFTKFIPITSIPPECPVCIITNTCGHTYDSNQRSLSVSNLSRNITCDTIIQGQDLQTMYNDGPRNCASFCYKALTPYQPIDPKWLQEVKTDIENFLDNAPNQELESEL